MTTTECLLLIFLFFIVLFGISSELEKTRTEIKPVCQRYIRLKIATAASGTDDVIGVMWNGKELYIMDWKNKNENGNL